MSPWARGLPATRESTPALAAAHDGLSPDALLPHPARLRAVEPETPGVATFWLEFLEDGRREDYRLRPGQFNMIYLPGIGEVPISVSGLPADGPGIGHTIRFVGRVTNCLGALKPGAVVGLRGPYGTGWPLEQALGRDVLVVAGGLGLAPLKLAVESLLADRGRCGRLILLYGAREPCDLLYQKEYAEWERRGLELMITVDRAGPGWAGRVGVVPLLLRRLRPDPSRTIMMTCGPEIMMRYAVAEALADRLDAGNISLSLERNMQCAVGLCGHCQLGPEFLCKDGPVLPYRRVARFLQHEHF
jgi:NAD(P)H-flavin reductase